MARKATITQDAIEIIFVFFVLFLFFEVGWAGLTGFVCYTWFHLLHPYWREFDGSWEREEGIIAFFKFACLLCGASKWTGAVGSRRRDHLETSMVCSSGDVAENYGCLSLTLRGGVSRGSSWRRAGSVGLERAMEVEGREERQYFSASDDANGMKEGQDDIYMQ